MYTGVIFRLPLPWKIDIELKNIYWSVLDVVINNKLSQNFLLSNYSLLKCKHAVSNFFPISFSSLFQNSHSLALLQI